jgi:hypothetical protein
MATQSVRVATKAIVITPNEAAGAFVARGTAMRRSRSAPRFDRCWNAGAV